MCVGSGGIDFRSESGQGRPRVGQESCGRSDRHLWVPELILASVVGGVMTPGRSGRQGLARFPP